MRCAARSSTSSRRARNRRSGSTSSATRSKACAASTRPTSASTDKADGFTLMPASEALLDEDSDQALPLALSRDVRRHRDRRPALPGGVAKAAGMAGMEHWLPLFEERLATLFDHLGDDDLDRPRRRRRPGAGKRGARRSTIITQNRERADGGEPGSYRPLEPQALYLAARRMERLHRRAADPPRLAVPRARKRHGRRLRRRGRARFRAGARAAGAMSTRRSPSTSPTLRKSEHKVVLASYTRGARERLTGLLEDHGLKTQKLADSWQEALGAQDAAPRCSSCRSTTASPRPTSPCSPSRTCSATGSSAGARSARAADAFLAELATLSPGDLVVHADHGIGRYEGLTQIPVGKAPHDCVALEYARRRQALRPGREYRRALALRQRERRRRRSTGSAARPGSGASRG